MNNRLTLGRLALVTRLTAFAIAAGSVAPGAHAAQKAKTQDTAAEDGERGTPLCLALPRVAIDDATPVVADFSKVLRERIATVVAGPLIEPHAIKSRLPVQARAEAQKAGCNFLLDVTFVHRPASQLGRRAADDALTVGRATQRVANSRNSASGAISAGSTLSGMLDSDRGSRRSNSSQRFYSLGKNDRVSMQYTLESLGSAAPITAEFTEKASKDNEPMVELLVDKTAAAVAEALLAQPK